ncbi:glycoside hydrolase family 5 protein [Parathielavia appendiculata]|uniref:glucan 1,3-beta-glucosidase n=1 Tax=Parathielavia appendiculata TaxID=2587402 RepID=A0AAN6TXY2_9PEZI|nr:glycoside hydrolase family 5 protein [Parathielavia appendiculata]
MFTRLATFSCCLVGLQQVLAAPAPSPSYLDWRTFTARGVDLGGWLHQEAVIDPGFWSQHGGSARDEWELCVNLGSRCGSVLEQRYASYIRPSDIDRLAAAGINVLRIPTGYNAWVKVPGSQLYTGRQVEHLRSISRYAIAQHGMHVIVDIHSLPGGLNGMGLGGREGGYDWFQNQTALDYSYRAVEAALAFIQTSDHPHGYTLAPINEPVDNRDMSKFGTPESLSEDGRAWVLAYFRGVLDRVRRVNRNIPVMLQGGFLGEEYWSPLFESEARIVFDVHNYYFAGRPATSANLPQFLCADARASAGDGRFPVFVGEWSIQATSNNTLASRRVNLNTGLQAWEKYTSGSAYWTYRFYGNVPVQGEGVQGDYWSYEKFMDLGIIDPSKGVSCV